MRSVAFASYPLPPTDPVVTAASEQLNPLLERMGFLAGQPGTGDGRAQIIYCRGFDASPDDGCIDLVIDPSSQTSGTSPTCATGASRPSAGICRSTETRTSLISWPALNEPCLNNCGISPG